VSEAARPGVTEDGLARLVAFQAARQEHLLGKRTPRINVVINEGVLHRQVGGPEVMQAQLQHVLDIAERSRVTVRVLPFSAGAHPAMVGSFTILRFPPGTGTPTIFVEVDNGALYPDRTEEIERYDWVSRRLREMSLSPEESAALIRKLAGGSRELS
jgi:hypothetical protein